MATIIYGPPGCGKSRNIDKLKAMFKAKRVIDEWDGKSPLRLDDLALTTNSPPFPGHKAVAFRSIKWNK